jgi:RNA polymerase sigma-70 factor (ECF subfamily)
MQKQTTARHDEAELRARLRRGDVHAFDELVRENSPRLIALARRILRDEELARDVVQEAFFSAHRAIGRFNGDSRLSSWLHRITVNAALASIRRRKRRPETFLSEEFGDREEDELPSGRSPWPLDEGDESAEELVARGQERQLVRSCLRRVKESHRRVLTLRYLEELDTAETARILGIAPNTVKTRLLRARTAMRGMVERTIATDRAA